MDYVNLGSTGMKVSRLCLGCMTFGQPDRGTHPWTLDAEKSLPIIRAALEAGINFFDTANSYSDGTSEEIVGAALREYARRDEVVIATKVYNRMKPTPNGGGLSRKAILHEIDQSLRRLGTDYVDLYQIHRWDPSTPIEETLEALHDVVKAGKARYIGASSMFAWQFAKALHTSDSRRLDALRHDAEPPQPALPRGRARDDAAVPRPGHRRDAVEPAGPRPAGAAVGPDQLADGNRRIRPQAVLGLRRGGPPGCRAGGRGGGAARRADGPGGARLGAGHGRGSPRRSSVPRNPNSCRTHWLR